MDSGFYACKALTKFGGRCRRKAEGGDFCALHQDADYCPPPDTILLKIRINPNWRESFEKVGIEFLEVSHNERDNRHAKEAEALGRKTDTFRPNGADSGVLVMWDQDSTRGLESISLETFWREVLSSGYIMTRVVMEAGRNNSEMSTLLIALDSSPRAQRVVLRRGAIETIKDLLRSSWGFVHVWANPPRWDGRRVDTIHAAHRHQDLVRRELKFSDGLYAVGEGEQPRPRPQTFQRNRRYS